MCNNIEPIIDLFAVLDEPGGALDKYIESFQLEYLNISNQIERTANPLANAQRFNELHAAHMPNKRVLRLMTSEAADVPIEALTLLSPPGVRNVVFTRNYRKSESEAVFVQGIPRSAEVDFDAKVGGHLSRIIRTQPVGSPINPAALPFPTTYWSYDDLDSYEPVIDKRHTLSIDIQGVKYDLFSDLRSGTGKLFVFGQSAINRNSVELPVFHRWKWMLDLSASAIALNDPTLYRNNYLDAGWWVGTRDRDYVEEAVSIVSKIAKSLGIGPESIIFYGGSAGGFSSFQMAACLPGSRVVADIPQIDLRKYHLPSAIDAALAAGLGYGTSDEVPREYLHRIDVIERFVRNEHVPDFLYLQNLRDSSHIRSHFEDFRTRLKLLRDRHSWARHSGRYETYSAWSLVRGGHFPLGRHETMRHLNNY